jgi:hypothetical protein
MEEVRSELSRSLRGADEQFGDETVVGNRGFVVTPVFSNLVVELRGKLCGSELSP